MEIEYEEYSASSASDDDVGESATTECPVRGVARSGRKWKVLQHKRSSRVRRDACFQKSWSIKQEERTKLASLKAMSNGLRETRKADRVAKAERRKVQEERRKINVQKSEVVQIIKNPAKLKRLKKKQLRTIQKRDTTVVSKDPVV